MKEKLRELFGLQRDQAENDEIRERIEAGAEVTGTNAYILLFAILIACIGLNVNSTAVVIGAMLISPLMGVIISIAYGIADRSPAWIRANLKKFAFQIGIGILTSTVYFILSTI